MNFSRFLYVLFRVPHPLVLRVRSLTFSRFLCALCVLCVKIPTQVSPQLLPHQKILSDIYNANFVKNKSAIIIITEDTTTACVVARPTPCVPPRTVNPL